VDALRIAERIRAHISQLPIYATGGAGSERVPVTVSIGVAALDAGSRRELNDLLAAADAALYRAKASGRDQVQMISTSRGLSAASPAAGSGVSPDGQLLWGGTMLPPGAALPAEAALPGVPGGLPAEVALPADAALPGGAALPRVPGVLSGAGKPAGPAAAGPEPVRARARAGARAGAGER
jgi:hypothetical protein